MAISQTRRGGLGGYIKGVLFGIVLIVLVLVGLSLVAPVGEGSGEGGLTAAENAEPELAAAEPAAVEDASEAAGPVPEAAGEPAEAGGPAGQAEAADGGAVVEVEVEVEDVADADVPVEPAPADVARGPGQPNEGETIRPVELAELPELPEPAAEAPADVTGGTSEPGAADGRADDLEQALEGQAETVGESALETDLEAVVGTEEDAPQEDLARAMPPPLSETRPIDLAGPALEVNASTYATPADEPVIGVIMDGVAGSELSPDVLFALPVPVTLGIVPGRDGDEALADAARARNWEVLAQLPVVGGDGEATPGALSGGMPPEEVAERTEALMGRLREAVAAESEGTLEDPDAVRAMLQALEAHGFGYVGSAAAGGEGPPNARPTTRVPRDASAEEVLAVLQDALDAAGPGGAALVVLPPTRAAAEALARWNAEAGAGRVAPLSAVIGRQAGG